MMRMIITAVALSALAAFGDGNQPPPPLGASLGVSQRIYSEIVTNKQWSITDVFVRDGELFDPTGTFTKKADLEYLIAVNEGMSEVLDGGSNGFVRAKAEFDSALESNPPQSGHHISMVIPPYEDTEPQNRNPYGIIAKEEGTTVSWYLSHPFTLKPVIVCETTSIDNSGKIATNYEATAFTDYFNDATNFPARSIGDYPRTVRMEDPPIPAGIQTVIRDSHLHWGHPKSGIEWGGMALDVIDGNGNLRHTVTGVYTARVDGVNYEFQFKNGATLKMERIGQ